MSAYQTVDIRKREGYLKYIPFYIARYEKDIALEKDISYAIDDLTYFRDELVRLHREGELTDAEMIDLMGFVNTIITHITNGNKNEERLVNIMGGVVIETESEKLIRKGIRQGIVQQICKKLQKDKPVEVIAEELEEELAEVEKVVAAQQKVGSYDVDEICKVLAAQEQPHKK